MKTRRKKPLPHFPWTFHKRITLIFIAQFNWVLVASAEGANNQKVPSAPKNLDLTQINASSVKVSWEPPDHGGETAEIMGYYVYKDLHVNGKNTNNMRKAVVIVDHNKHYAFINDLEPNSEYAIRVAAFNQYGDGEHSSIKRIMTGGRPPSAPRPQSIQPIKEDKPVEARIEWLPPKHTYGLPILKYLIWYKPVDLNSFEKSEVGPSEMRHTLTNLHNGQEYELHLAAVNEVGVGENATEHFFTPAGLPNGEPLNIRYTIFKNHLTILWDPPLWLHRNGNITQYKIVFKSVQGRNSGQIVEKNLTSQSIVFEVDSKTSYSFKVAAATVKGQGPYSAILSINSNASTSIGPPKNLRVQALTNSSVVVQWEFDEVANDGFADGFVVKYMHEPSGGSANPADHYRATAGSGQDNWRTQTVMDSKARHLEITRLAQKPYAFCVLAIKHSRLGPCSDPPITLDQLKPTFVVQELHVQYKTSQSVALHWDYIGSPNNIGFYIKQMGVKTYHDQYLEEKTLVSPGFEKKIDGTERYFLWQNLRPYMNHTFQIGVYSLDDGRLYWPKELSVQTDPTGPPFVDTPEFIQSPSPTTAYLRLSCASEEYGPISHYWLIVVPGNYTKEDVVNVDSAKLQRSTSKHRAVFTDTGNNSYAGKEKRQNSKSRMTRSISLRQVSTHHLDGVYITAQISSHQMQRYYRDERTFTLGDGKEYEGYLNVPLDVSVKYQLMARAFTREDSWRRSSDHPFEFRPPMQEPASRLFTDSMLSAPFSTRSSNLISSSMGRASNIWLIGPAIAIFVIFVIVGMLVVWWLRCSRKSFRGLNTRHGSVTKVALGMAANSNGEFNGNGGLPNETSKLLLGMDADGRPVMNAYERPVMNDTHVMNMYPDNNLSHTNLCINSNSSQAQLNNGGFATIGNIHSQNQLSNSNMMLNSTTLVSTQPIPIPLTQFATHIDRLKINNNALFIQEYESIETGQHFTWENSMLDVNKHKNRYANVVAYDHSRVILSFLNGEPNDGSDYINANYIDGYEKPRAYIATQGPLPETFADFWRMVWEERCATIVMLTRLEERSRTKCDQYWPTRGSSVYGNFRVTLLDTTELAHYCIRVMRLEDLRTKEHREIQHAQFTAWPDHGVPNHPTPFLMFLKRVKSLNPIDAGPILTHCSAGIGRTGAFIVIDCMLDRLRYELTIDIYGCVKAIRAQRSYMVQTDDQYIFIHDAVLDAAQSGSTEVPSSKLPQHVQVLSHPQRQMDDATGMEIEFGTLVTLKCPNSKCMAANLMLNASKNRSPNTLPYDANRVELQFCPEVEGSDYINASWIDGYRTRNAYIAAQAPLANTVNDFWRMVWNEECCLIAMLTKLTERGQEKSCEYWPNERRESYNGLVVDCVSEFDMTHYMLREFKITESESGKSRTVRQFQFMEWPDRGVPNTAERFVDYVRQVHQTKIQFGSKGPICVHCSEGAGRTGVFIAVSTIIERIMQEHVVDIFTAVKLLRMQRQNMVESREQYEFCYAAAIEFLNSYDEN